MRVLFAALPAHACPLSCPACTSCATQICAALDKGALYVNMHDLSLHVACNLAFEEHRLRRQLRLAGRLLSKEAAFPGAVSQCVAMRMQAAGLPCLQPDAVQAWLDSGN